MSRIVCRYAVLISQDVDRDEAAFRKRCLLRGAAEQAEQKFSYVRHRGRVNVEGIGAVLHRLVPQRIRTNNTVHAAIVGLACCGIFLNHRNKLILAAAFSKKVLKPGAAREYAKRQNQPLPLKTRS
jgi:hypothetical protein